MLLLAPAPLPERRQYYVPPPAGGGLWTPVMLVAPVVVCFAEWPWIRSGGR
ncbi:hypothetical protein [Streptomyces sp. cg40]|uniref:hypothetical protein n=1 Tax=Streptomyces sp. cg40 TaxID=3419764 RepID=UPI003CFF4E45